MILEHSPVTSTMTPNHGGTSIFAPGDHCNTFVDPRQNVAGVSFGGGGKRSKTRRIRRHNRRHSIRCNHFRKSSSKSRRHRRRRTG